MHVLVFSQHFWPESFRINDLVVSLVERGIEVTVITGKPNYPDGKIYEGYTASGVITELYHGATIIRVPLYPRGNRNIFKLTMNYLSFIIFASLYIIINKKKLNPDLLFVYATSPILQAIPAILLKQLKKTPIALYVQDLWPESLEATGYITNKYFISFVRQVVRLIYNQSNIILVSSMPFIEFIERISPKSKCSYLPNSVDLSFSSSNNSPEIEIPALNDGFTVVFAGNVGSAQAVDVIVEAAALLSTVEDIRFVIIGSGSKINFLETMIAYYQLKNIFLVGRFQIEFMPPLLRRASILLVTLSDHPIFAATVPNKIQAYMAIGRPIVACMNGEGGRLVQDARAGLSVPAKDAQKLAEAIHKLYQMPKDQLDQLGENGKNYFHDNFDHDRLVTKLLDHLSLFMRKKI